MVTQEQPPTYHKLKKLTQGFEDLGDAYGVCVVTFREIHPMPFVVIIFPFLFAVMPGTACWSRSLLSGWSAKRNNGRTNGAQQEVWTIFFGGRDVIFFMGPFSIYTGLISNDVFSKSNNLFGAAWRERSDRCIRCCNDKTLDRLDSVILERNPTPSNGTSTSQKMFSGDPYSLALDPVS